MVLSERYDEFYRSSQKKETLSTLSIRSWPRSRMEAIIAVEGNGNCILDIGCGNGYLLYQFRDRFSSLIGFEFSKMRLSQAILNLEDYKFIPVLGTAENMHQVESNSIDRIISADTVEHVPDIYAAVAEMFRVLKPGGTLVINTPNVAFVKKRALLFVGRFPSTSQPNEGLGSDLLFDGGHLHYLTFRSLTLLLERAGFRVVRRMGYGPFGLIHNFWPTLLSGGAQVVAERPQ